MQLRKWFLLLLMSLSALPAWGGRIVRIDLTVLGMT
jgi:hypothetical protein